MMANDDDNNNNNSMSFNLDESPPTKKGNTEGLDLETLRRMRSLVSIDYVRVKNVIWDDDDREIIERSKIEDPDFKPTLMGTVLVMDCLGGDLVYHYFDAIDRDELRLGEPIELIGPTRPISAYDRFVISIVFWVLPRDYPSPGEVLKEIARGDIVWDPNQSSYDQPLQHDFLGKYGTVSVGYSVITKALSATVDVVWMNEPPARIYGTIKAVRSSTTRILFNKRFNECARIGKRQQSVFRYPSLPFPLPVDSNLTIEVDLWDRFSSVKQIALGSLHFTPKFGTQKQDIGGVQVSITCE